MAAARSLLEKNLKYYGRDGNAYLPDPELVAATNVALLLEIPLLLTGAPGCGKTDFAWAAAGALHHEKSPITTAHERVAPLTCYVRSDTRARDLLYYYDAVRRFGDAQHGGHLGQRRAADARRYIELQGLGRALIMPQRQVVLIDEIDKAPRDLPNDLLYELDRGEFEIPDIPNELPMDAPQELREDVFSHGISLRRQMNRPQGVSKPLVIITSNVERQLPDAFLRRCVFFHIEFPSRGVLYQMLRDRFGELLGKIDGGGGIGPQAETFLSASLALFEALRAQSLTKAPATAELINWVQSMLSFGKVPELLSLTVSAGNASTQPDWSRLPLPSCLLKLHEDWQRLGLRATVAH